MMRSLWSYTFIRIAIVIAGLVILAIGVVWIIGFFGGDSARDAKVDAEFEEHKKEREAWQLEKSKLEEKIKANEQEINGMKEDLQTATEARQSAGRRTIESRKGREDEQARFQRELEAQGRRLGPYTCADWLRDCELARQLGIRTEACRCQ